MKNFIFNRIITYIILTEPGFKEQIVIILTLLKLKIQTFFKNLK